MYNPDDLKDVKTQRAVVMGTPKVSPSLQLASPQEVFNTYMDESAKVRERYGISRCKETGKFVVGDLTLIKKLDPSLRGLLREWVRTKQRMGKF